MFSQRHLVPRPFGSRKAFTAGGPIQHAPRCLYRQKLAISSCTSSQSLSCVKRWAGNLHPVLLAQVQGLIAMFFSSYLQVRYKSSNLLGSVQGSLQIYKEFLASDSKSHQFVNFKGSQVPLWVMLIFEQLPSFLPKPQTT
jgi:hypothetical protein